MRNTSNKPVTNIIYTYTIQYTQHHNNCDTCSPQRLRTQT